MISIHFPNEFPPLWIACTRWQPWRKIDPFHRGVATVHADITSNKHSASSSSYGVCKASSSPPVGSTIVWKCVQKPLATGLPGLQNSSLIPFQLQASLHSFCISFQQSFSSYFFLIFSSIFSCQQHGKMSEDSRDPERALPIVMLRRNGFIWLFGLSEFYKFKE